MDLPFWTLIVAAGTGSRLGGEPKQFRRLCGRSLLARATAPFAEHADSERIVIAVAPGDEARAALLLKEEIGIAPRLIAGGATRQESVSRGLAAIPDADGWVAVHDAARPFFDGRCLREWRARLEAMGDAGALVPVLPLHDTVVDGAAGWAAAVLDRARLGRAQTPQLFRLTLLRRAHAAALTRGERDAGDDGGLVLALGEKLATVPGDPGNFKITGEADWRRADARFGGQRAPARTGIGYDSHRFAPGRPLVLGGVTVPSAAGGLAGHSDADVLTHAIMDALLGAAALGDIGRHFPDTDPAWAGARSLDLLARVLDLLRARGLAPGQVDASVLAETPRLSAHIDAMRASLAAALNLHVDRVSVKATTNEGMGAIGRGEGIAVLAIATLEEMP